MKMPPQKEHDRVADKIQDALCGEQVDVAFFATLTILITMIQDNSTATKEDLVLLISEAWDAGKQVDAEINAERN